MHIKSAIHNSKIINKNQQQYSDTRNVVQENVCPASNSPGSNPQHHTNQVMVGHACNSNLPSGGRKIRHSGSFLATDQVPEQPGEGDPVSKPSPLTAVAAEINVRFVH